MSALRCTAKLLKAMKAAPVASPAPAQNRLGEWTANLIRVGRIQLVLAVNESTRLGLVIDAAPYATIPERFTRQVFKSLLWLGIEGDQAAVEAEASRPIQFAASNSRSVLSTLTRFAFDMEAWLYYGHTQSAAELSQRLAGEIVCEPKHIGIPADRVREVFGLPPIDRRLISGLGQGVAPDVERAQVTEVRRRIAQLESGAAKLMAGRRGVAQVRTAIRKHASRWRPGYWKEPAPRN